MKGSEFYTGYHRATTKVSLFFKTLGLSISFFLVFFAVVFSLSLALWLDLYEFKNAVSFHLAGWMDRGVFPVQKDQMAFFTEAGERVMYSVSNRDSIPILKESSKVVGEAIYWVAVISISLAIILTRMAVYFIAEGRQKKERKEFIRGGKFASSESLAKAIKDTNKGSSLELGGVPIPREVLPVHFGFGGDSGTGKSQALFRVINWAKNTCGEKGFVVDKTGEFVQHFFDPDRDIILSPFDDRSVGWTPFNEGTELFDCERMAKSFIPMKAESMSGNEHWPEASLTVLSWLLLKLHETGRTQVDDLIKVLGESEKRIEKDLLGRPTIVVEKAINKLLSDTPAQIVIDEDAPEHAISVIGTLLPKIRSLFYLRGLENRPQFSIRDWAADSSDKRWVFIRVTEDQLDAVNPVVTAWIDTLIKSVISLEKSSERVIWGVIDELQSFERINSLKKGTQEGRKYGLRMLLGYASISELQDVYGEKVFKGIVSMLGTKLVYRTTEPEAADWNSKVLLEEDVIMEREGISFGANDNLNASDDRKEQALVTRSEIQTLPNFHAYLRLAGDWPTTRIEFKYKAWPDVATPFVRRAIPEFRGWGQEEGSDNVNQEEEQPAASEQHHRAHPRPEGGAVSGLAAEELEASSPRRQSPLAGNDRLI